MDKKVGKAYEMVEHLALSCSKTTGEVKIYIFRGD